MARGRSRRFAGSASARRRRVWARTSFQLATVDPAPATDVTDMLDHFVTASLGRVEVGCTVGAVKLDLAVSRVSGTAPNPGVIWGLIVGPRTLDPDDLNPADFTTAAGAHSDWMMWGFAPVVAFEGVRHYDVKSQRKLDEVGDTLWFAVTGNAGADVYNVKVTASTLLLLP